MILIDFHTIGEWEAANIKGKFIFSHFYYYKSTRVIRKVTGYVNVHKMDINDTLNHLREGLKKIRWNSQGKCYNCNNNHRLRDYDIHF